MDDVFTTKIADVGTVRTDTVETWVASKKFNRSDIVIVEDQRLRGLKGENFPFEISTDIYPEWPLAAMPEVPEQVAKLVTMGMLAIPKGPAYMRFVTPSTYNAVQKLILDVGVVDTFTKRCRTSEDLYDGLSCPVGYYKVGSQC